MEQVKMVLLKAAPMLEKAIEAVYYAYSPALFLYFVISSTISVCALQSIKLKKEDQHVRRNVLLSLMIATAGTFFIEVLVVFTRCIIQKNWTSTQHYNVYLLSAIIIWGLQILSLSDAKFPVWYPYYGSWILGVLIDLFLIVITNVLHPPHNAFDAILIAIPGLRISILILLLNLYGGLRNRKQAYPNEDAERQALLAKKLAPKPGSANSSPTSSAYGTVDNSSNTSKDSSSDSDDDYYAKKDLLKKRIIERLQNDGSWWTYAKEFSIFIPLIWPFHSKTLQLRAVLVGICLLATNFLNIMIPRQLGLVTDRLAKGTIGGNLESSVDTERSAGDGPWVAVSLYVLFKFLSSSSGIGLVRWWLWRPVQQYSYEALSTTAHAHLMNLSSDFHDNKTTSELSQAIRQGRSVSRLMEMICFKVLPTFIDLTVAFTYLYWLFGPYMALVTGATTVLFLYATTKFMAQAIPTRRTFIKAMRKEAVTVNQGFEGWQNASYFDRISYEICRYKDVILHYLGTEKLFYTSWQVVYAVQSFIMTLGLLVACYLAIYQVWIVKTKTVGDFVTLLTYWSQLNGPLLFFSEMFSSISSNMMDAERLLELMQTKPTIVDAPKAKNLDFKNGEIQFDQVGFSYDSRKSTLENVSFTVPAGSTVALVGETGGGKSTILKLITRFYDVTKGTIEIDGQDIRQIKLSSLRSKIGVVPQDPSLFNDTIMSNLRYAKLEATDDDVYNACRAAQIHEKILSFPDGYQSTVGERGVKLSGGERQRIAIARAILKDPRIILLDEATSAVDTDTEQKIQEALGVLCKNRTTIIVAHRLSTIMRADRIMVIKEGHIIEQGSHEDLFYSKGKYHDLWSKQIFVKPLDEAEKTPKKGDIHIINDVGTERKSVKLSEALRHDGHPPASPKLKPDAPEFVPRSQPTTENTDNSDQVESKTESADRPKLSTGKRRQFSNLAKKAANKAGKLQDHPDYEQTSAADDLQSTTLSDSESKDQAAGSSTTEKYKSKKSRFGRRNQTKSEPANRAQDSIDGTNDSELTGDGSSEAPVQYPASSIPRRRVSAPSDPQSGSQDLRGTSRGQRPKRTRHWRLKQRLADEGSHREGKSADRSTSTDTPNDPETPNTSPAENPSPAEDIRAAVVKFAPGS